MTQPQHRKSEAVALILGPWAVNCRFKGKGIISPSDWPAGFENPTHPLSMCSQPICRHVNHKTGIGQFPVKSVQGCTVFSCDGEMKRITRT